MVGAPVHGRLMPVPANKVIHDRAPLDDGAVICHGTVSDAIYCFVPPLMGF